MTKYEFPPDVRLLVDASMVRGGYQSEDDVLRHALRALQAEDEDVAAVREAIAEWQDGDAGIAIDEVFDAVRASALQRPTG